MPVKFTPTSNSALKRLVREAIEQGAPELTDEASIQAQRILRFLFEQTFGGISGESQYYDSRTQTVRTVKKFDSPQVDIEEIDRGILRAGIFFVLRAQVLEGASVHKLWYWLSRGTDEYTQQNKSPAFFDRANPLRTYTSGRYNLGPRVGYMSTPRVLMPGQTRDGIKAQDWEQKIVEDFRQQMRLQAIGGFDDWSISYEIVPW